MKKILGSGNIIESFFYETLNIYGYHWWAVWEGMPTDLRVVGNNLVYMPKGKQNEVQRIQLGL